MPRPVDIANAFRVLKSLDRRFQLSKRDGGFRELLAELHEAVEPESLTPASAVPDPSQPVVSPEPSSVTESGAEDEGEAPGGDSEDSGTGSTEDSEPASESSESDVVGPAVLTNVDPGDENDSESEDTRTPAEVADLGEV